MTTQTTTTAKGAEKLDRLPCLRRVQNSNYSDWHTLRYDELGPCRILAAYHWSGELCGGGGLVVEHEGRRKLGYLSCRDDGEYAVVLSTIALAGSTAEAAVLDSRGDYNHDTWANIELMLAAREGNRRKVRNRTSGWIEKKPHPTTDSKVVIGLR